MSNPTTSTASSSPQRPIYQDIEALEQPSTDQCCRILEPIVQIFMKILDLLKGLCFGKEESNLPGRVSTLSEPNAQETKRLCGEWRSFTVSAEGAAVLLNESSFTPADKLEKTAIGYIIRYTGDTGDVVSGQISESMTDGRDLEILRGIQALRCLDQDPVDVITKNVILHRPHIETAGGERVDIVRQKRDSDETFVAREEGKIKPIVRQKLAVLEAAATQARKQSNP